MSSLRAKGAKAFDIFLQSNCALRFGTSSKTDTPGCQAIPQDSLEEPPVDQTPDLQAHQQEMVQNGQAKSGFAFPSSEVSFATLGGCGQKSLEAAGTGWASSASLETSSQVGR